jgi:hypothetical protein
MIENKLPKDIDFNKLSLRMVSGEVDELWFSFRHGVLKPGKNTFRVTCEVRFLSVTAAIILSV